MGRPDMGEDPRFADNAGRVDHEPEIDAVIAAWMKGMTSEQALNILDDAEVPSGPIYSVADMFADEHFKARGLFEQVESNGAPLVIPAMIPKLSDTPGETRWPGPPLGAHNVEILSDMLGLDAAQIEALKNSGAI
jgi:crotonobetainyl-CoA:carnitine CoA-transferase CaiB-like acyl-CoA transferase